MMTKSGEPVRDSRKAVTIEVTERKERGMIDDAEFMEIRLLTCPIRRVALRVDARGTQRKVFRVGCLRLHFLYAGLHRSDGMRASPRGGSTLHRLQSTSCLCVHRREILKILPQLGLKRNIS